MKKITCDYCGAQIINEDENKFIMPVQTKIVAKGGIENKITCEINGITQKAERDVCFRCQNKIARFCNLLSFVDVNMYDIELEVFNKFKESIINKEWKVKEWT